MGGLQRRKHKESNATGQGSAALPTLFRGGASHELKIIASKGVLVELPDNANDQSMRTQA